MLCKVNRKSSETVGGLERMEGTEMEGSEEERQGLAAVRTRAQALRAADLYLVTLGEEPVTIARLTVDQTATSAPAALPQPPPV